MRDLSYAAVMDRRATIMKTALGLDYGFRIHGGLAFDYEAMMDATGYTLDEMAEIQRSAKVGDTPSMSCRA